jgi:prepilin-type N-terminal cleavage/methylation domain-containing protein
MQNLRTRADKAFTLVELLIVIAIIGFWRLWFYPMWLTYQALERDRGFEAELVVVAIRSGYHDGQRRPQFDNGDAAAH